MDIVTNQLSQLLTTQVNAKAANSLMLGELLSATVIKRNSENSITIKVKGNLIDAKMQNEMPIKTGDKLQLRVESVQSPIQLKLIKPAKIQPRQVLEQLLRENLPKQTKLDQLINTIKPGNIAKTDGLPITVKQQLQQLVEQFPKPNQLQQAPVLKESILNSGLFFEAKIFQQLKSLAQKQIPLKAAHASSSNTTLDTLFPLTKDLKAELLKLSNLIQQQTKTENKHARPVPGSNNPAPNIKQVKSSDVVKTVETQPNKQPVNAIQSSVNNVITKDFTQKIGLTNIKTNTQTLNPILMLDTETLIKHVESAIARIETNQARAINTELNPVHHFVVEIPVKDKDDLDLITIDLNQEHGRDKQDEASNWSVKLKIEFGDKGHFYANVSLYNGEIQLNVWSENQNIDQLIDSNLEKLNNNLARKGLSVSRCQHINQAPAQPQQPIQSDNLISITL